MGIKHVVAYSLVLLIGGLWDASVLLASHTPVHAQQEREQRQREEQLRALTTAPRTVQPAISPSVLSSLTAPTAGVPPRSVGPAAIPQSVLNSLTAPRPPTPMPQPIRPAVVPPSVLTAPSTARPFTQPAPFTSPAAASAGLTAAFSPTTAAQKAAIANAAALVPTQPTPSVLSSLTAPRPPTPMPQSTPPVVMATPAPRPTPPTPSLSSVTTAPTVQPKLSAPIFSEIVPGRMPQSTPPVVMATPTPRPTPPAVARSSATPIYDKSGNVVTTYYGATAITSPMQAGYDPAFGYSLTKPSAAPFSVPSSLGQQGPAVGPAGITPAGLEEFERLRLELQNLEQQQREVPLTSLAPDLSKKREQLQGEFNRLVEKEVYGVGKPPVAPSMPMPQPTLTIPKTPDTSSFTPAQQKAYDYAVSLIPKPTTSGVQPALPPVSLQRPSTPTSQSTPPAPGSQKLPAGEPIAAVSKPAISSPVGSAALGIGKAPSNAQGGVATRTPASPEEIAQMQGQIEKMKRILSTAPPPSPESTATVFSRNIPGGNLEAAQRVWEVANHAKEVAKVHLTKAEDALRAGDIQGAKQEFNRAAKLGVLSAQTGSAAAEADVAGINVQSGVVREAAKAAISGAAYAVPGPAGKAVGTIGTLGLDYSADLIEGGSKEANKNLPANIFSSGVGTLVGLGAQGAGGAVVDRMIGSKSLLTQAVGETFKEIGSGSVGKITTVGIEHWSAFGTKPLLNSLLENKGTVNAPYVLQSDMAGTTPMAILRRDQREILR